VKSATTKLRASSLRRASGKSSLWSSTTRMAARPPGILQRMPLHPFDVRFVSSIGEGPDAEGRSRSRVSPERSGHNPSRDTRPWNEFGNQCDKDSGSENRCLPVAHSRARSARASRPRRTTDQICGRWLMPVKRPSRETHARDSDTRIVVICVRRRRANSRQAGGVHRRRMVAWPRRRLRKSSPSPREAARLFVTANRNP
jgi:hypothetical protein